MAYNNSFRGKGRSSGGRSDTRLTGLFKTKRQGLFVGSAKAEQLEALIKKIKEAKTAGKGLAFFLWKNTFGDGPAFSLNVDVEKDQSERPARRKQVEPDPDFEDDIEDEDEDLFGNK